MRAPPCRHLGQWLCAGAALCLLPACDRVVLLGALPLGVGLDAAAGLPADSLQDAGSATPSQCSTALVCEGFEQAMLPTTRADEATGASVTLNGQQVHTGSQSAQFITTAAESWAAVVHRFPAVESGSLYTRAHFFLPVGTLTGRVNIINMESNQVFHVDVNFAAGGEVEAYFHTDSVRVVSASNVVPQGEWFCLRTALHLDNAVGSVEVWVNDTLQLSTPAQYDTLPEEGVNEVEFGALWTEAGQTATELYIDDIVVDTRPIACQ